MGMVISQTKSKNKISKENSSMDSCTREFSSNNQASSVESSNKVKYMESARSSGVMAVDMRGNSKITV